MHAISPSLRWASTFIGSHWLAITLLLIFTGIHIQYRSKITHSDHGIRSAFLRWQVQLHDLDDGVNVWDKYAYPNPPIMALILKPFLSLSPLLGSSLWFYCKAILAVVSIILVFALFNDPERPFPLWGKILAIALSLRPIEGDLVHGNVNLLILFLIVTALFAFCHRYEYVAGLLLGLSIACKLTPILFIAYFLWKRAGRVVLGAIAGLFVFVLVIPGAVFGWSENLAYLRSWHAQMVAPYAAGIVTSEHKNQSLPGLLHRILAEQASFSDYEGDRKIVLDTHNIVSWDRGTVHVIIIACMIGFALLMMWRCRASTERRPSWQFLAECSIIILGMLLFCERTWKHHCVTLLLPFSVAAYGLSARGFSSGMRWYLGMTLAAVALLMLATSTGHFDAHVEAHARPGKLAQVYGAYVWAFLLLLAAMFVMLGKTRQLEQP